MTGEPLAIASLRQLPSGSLSGQGQPTYPLSIEQIVAIGRDSRCQIVLDPITYSSVSRRHIEIRPAAAQRDGQPTWWVCDLNSSNGTYLNGKRLRGCRVLKAGDLVALGQNGPEFVFDYCQRASPAPSAVVSPSNGIEPISPPLHHPRSSVTFTQLFPIASAGLDLRQKAYLAPGIITVGFVVSLFVAIGNPLLFNLLLAAYIALSAFYFIYQLCGKHKPWWVLLMAGIATMLLLQSPVLPLFIILFRQLLPGQVPEAGEPMNFVVLLIRMFFGAGLMEELLKALPLIGFYLLGRLLPTPWKEHVGIWEPLDGILLGAASAVGFTLSETLGQYVPDIIQSTTLQLGDGPKQLIGLQLLIPRLLGSISGHMAYSGYFGYFIGLSVLKPRQSGIILGIGYLSAASLHALWNAMGSVSPFILAIVGVLSYAFLGAAILKARTLSPTRSQNFATRLKQ